MGREPAIKRYQTKSGNIIHRMTLEAFFEFWTFVYLVLATDSDGKNYTVLIDSGSGYGHSNKDLERGLTIIAEREDRFSGMKDLTHVLITHGHIDHFGGLPFLRERTSAEFGIHDLDFRTVTRYDQRLQRISKKLKTYLLQGGLSPQEVEELIDIYQASKLTYEDTPIDFTYQALGMKLGPFQMLHVPGHCPGHVVLQLDELLFCGDHILPEITPHQSPECLTLNTGLDHYLGSLQTLKNWSKGIDIALPGHEGEIMNFDRRIEEIETVHHRRFQQILNFLDVPHTIKDTAKSLFGEVHGYQGYNRLLALEEAGAHIEYLYLRGLIQLENFTEAQAAKDPIPLYYSRITP